MADPLAETILASLRPHISALSEQHQVLEVQGAHYFEAACRLNRGIHELEVAAKLLATHARLPVSP